MVTLFLFLILLLCPTPTQAAYYSYPFATQTVDAISRQKMQIPQGIYDSVSNKTFIVYPAGVTSSGLSEVSPYIISYSHTTHSWSSPVKIITSPHPPDSHNYPQLLIDSNGYLHVFQTFHGQPILHATSSNPRDISQWNFSYLTGVSATYGAAVKAKNGDFYLFFRNGLSGGSSGPSGWHEPEYYYKSTNNGANWTLHSLIDPLKNSDGWNTIYVKSLHYESNPERVHIVFALTYNHNDKFKKHYYVFFNLNNNHIYSANGQDYGTTIDRNEFQSNCELYSYSQPLNFNDYGNTHTAFYLDNNGKPNVFYNKYIPGQSQLAHSQLWWAKWDGSNWQHQHLSNFDEVVGPMDVKYINDSNIDLFISKWDGATIPGIIYHYNGSSWTQSWRSDLTPPPYHFTYIYDSHPDITATFYQSDYQGWNTPKPIGTFHVFGNNNFSSSCPAPNFKHYRWSGSPHFVFPTNSPCDQYSIGSKTPSSGEIYSPLTQVQPNTTYTISYQVKTESVASTAPFVATVLVSEYNSSAKESDSINQSRTHDGQRTNVPKVTGTTNWQTKQYTFTTLSNTKYIRFRRVNAAWGEASGETYFKDVKLSVPTPTSTPKPSNTPTPTPTSPGCPTSTDKSYRWSGTPNFTYPKTTPCDQYSLDSDTPSSGEIYTPLTTVSPNTTYTISYQVKTESIASIAPFVATVLVSEYSSSAKETDLVNQNRTHDGQRTNIPQVTGTTNWQTKQYTFTTLSNTKYVRFRRVNSAWGEAIGKVYFKNIQLVASIPTNTPKPTNTPTKTPTKVPTTPPKKLGDANGDGKVNLLDFGTWKTEYLTKTGLNSDFDKNNKVNIADFAIWKTEYLKTK